MLPLFLDAEAVICKPHNSHLIFISATHFRVYIIRPTAISAIILGK